MIFVSNVLIKSVKLTILTKRLSLVTDLTGHGGLTD